MAPSPPTPFQRPRSSWRPPAGTHHWRGRNQGLRRGRRGSWDCISRYLASEVLLPCPAQDHGGHSLVVCWPDTGEERIPPGLHALNTEPSSAQAGLLCGLGLGSAMAEAGASIWLRSPHLFPGTAPWPLGHPALAVDVKIAFSLVPGHSEHELELLALLEYMGPHCHPVRHERLLQLQQHGNSSGQLLLFSPPQCTRPYLLPRKGKASMRSQQSLHIHIDFHNGYTCFNAHKQWTNVPHALHPNQHELSLVLLILVILTNVQ